MQFIKSFLKLGLILAFLGVLFLSASIAAKKIIVLEWENLVPGDTLNPDERGLPWIGPEVRLGEITHDQIPLLQPKSDKPAPLVTDYNGKTIKIAGYMVPLDFESTQVKEFLLVPYVGACIHVPPPPGNQIIYIKSEKGVPVYDIYTPINVTGKLQSGEFKTAIAVEIGYSMQLDVITEYSDVQ